MGKPDCFAVQDYRKSFLPAKSVAEIDRGLHSARSRHAEGFRQTDLTYLHFHNKPFATLLHQARQKLERFVDVEDLNLLTKYRGPGLHLGRYFRMTEADYRAQHDDRLLLRYPQFGRLMDALGVTGDLFAGDASDADFPADPDAVGFVPPGGRVADAVPFSPLLYGEAHRDVRDGGWNPIHHYVAHGYREKRIVPRRADRP